MSKTKILIVNAAKLLKNSETKIYRFLKLNRKPPRLAKKRELLFRFPIAKFLSEFLSRTA